MQQMSTKISTMQTIYSFNLLDLLASRVLSAASEQSMRQGVYQNLLGKRRSITKLSGHWNKPLSSSVSQVHVLMRPNQGIEGMT